MKAKDYRDNINKMTLEELAKEENELRADLFKIRFDSATHAINNPGKVKFIKRDIARVKTAIRAKQMAAEQAASDKK